MFCCSLLDCTVIHCGLCCTVSMSQALVSLHDQFKHITEREFTDIHVLLTLLPSPDQCAFISSRTGTYCTYNL